MRSLISAFIVWALRCSFTEFFAYCAEQHFSYMRLLHERASDKKETSTNLQHCEVNDWIESQCGSEGCRGTLCPPEQGSAAVLS